MFCGDDTWLKLFPGRFLDRSEGIVSFYVNDYIEVGLLISSPSISLIFRSLSKIYFNLTERKIIISIIFSEKSIFAIFLIFSKRSQMLYTL